MNKLYSLLRTFAISTSFILLAGCGGGDGGSDQNFDGTWQGRTSNGGTVTFTVDGDWVTSLRLTDPAATLWFPQSVDIHGSTFDAEYETDTATTDDVRLQTSFNSATQASGTYSIRKGSQLLTGTFQASRQ